MPFSTEAVNLEITSPYVELFDLDLGPIGSNTVLYFTPNIKFAPLLAFKGHNYNAWPITMTGAEVRGDGTQVKPQVTVSIVNDSMLDVVLGVGDLIGAKVTRYRTFEKFLDNGSEPDSAAHFPAEVFIIDQKVSHTKVAITWSMTSVIDRFGMRLPRRQVLRDGDSRNPGFPGVSRFRGRRS